MIDPFAIIVVVCAASVIALGYRPKGEVMTFCTCDPGDYWQPPAWDSECPIHGDENGGEPPSDREPQDDREDRDYPFAADDLAFDAWRERQ